MAKKDCAVAYVDGSYKQPVAGYGIVFLYENEKPEFFSGKCDSASMKNVSGEIYAARLATEKALEYGCKSIKIFHDYNGIADWVTGKWKAKKNETQDYRDSMRSYQENLKIEFCKVKGHSGVKWNEKADDLAKKAIKVNKKIEISPNVLNKLEKEAQEKGILLVCAKTIYLLHQKENPKFNDFKNLKVGGWDRFSMMHETELENLITEELKEEVQKDEMLKIMKNPTLYASALKWRMRGLTVDEAVHKVNVDDEINDNWEKSKQQNK